MTAFTINDVSKVTEEMMSRKVVNFILSKRLCPECARIEWKDEDKNQSFTMLPGICGRCHKLGVVAYIEKGL